MHRFQSPEKQFPKRNHYSTFLFSSYVETPYQTSLNQVPFFSADPPPMCLAQGSFRSGHSLKIRSVFSAAAPHLGQTTIESRLTKWGIKFQEIFQIRIFNFPGT